MSEQALEGLSCKTRGRGWWTVVLVDSSTTSTMRGGLVVRLPNRHNDIAKRGILMLILHRANARGNRGKASLARRPSFAVMYSTNYVY